MDFLDYFLYIYIYVYVCVYFGSPHRTSTPTRLPQKEAESLRQGAIVLNANGIVRVDPCCKADVSQSQGGHQALRHGAKLQ